MRGKNLEEIDLIHTHEVNNTINQAELATPLQVVRSIIPEDHNMDVNVEDQHENLPFNKAI